MEAAGITSRHLNYSAASLKPFPYGYNNRKPSHPPFSRQILGIRSPLIESGDCGFRDRSHMQFYCSASGSLRMKEDSIKTRCDKSKKKEAKKLKLLQGLYQNLYTLSHSDLEFDLDPSSMEAVGVLMKRLEQLRPEMEERMRMDKASGKEKRIAERKEQIGMMVMDANDSSSSSSSSSSSESSDSEGEQCTKGSITSCISTASTAVEHAAEEHQQLAVSLSPNMEFQAPPTQITTAKNSNINKVPTPMLPRNRIEVCVGGKCKKAGSLTLMEELEKAVGGAGAVASCKCMGKCKTAPNVRVVNDSCSTLFLGAAAEDVDAVVVSLLRQKIAVRST